MIGMTSILKSVTIILHCR